MYSLHFVVADVNLVCSHCHAQFVERHNLDSYLKNSPAYQDDNPQLFKCRKCGKVSSALINFQQHIRRHEQNNHPTSSTYSNSQDIPTLRSTLSTMDNSFPQEVSYSLKPQTSVIASDSLPFHCDVCNEGFMLCVELCSHLEIHHQDKEGLVKMCTNFFVKDCSF